MLSVILSLNIFFVCNGILLVFQLAVGMKNLYAVAWITLQPLSTQHTLTSQNKNVVDKDKQAGYS